MSYAIVVTQLVYDSELDGDDQDYRPEGVYSVEAKNEDMALDIFHEAVPIACLDDYDIQVFEYKGEVKPLIFSDYFKKLNKTKKGRSNETN